MTLTTTISPAVSDETSTDDTSTSSTCRLLIAIINYKCVDLTVACLKSLEPQVAALPGTRVTVVENASGEAQPLADAIAHHGWSHWVRLDDSPDNGGFAAGNNRAIRPALASDTPPDYVLLLNADTEVRDNALQALLDFMHAHPKVGLAGSSFENLDGSDWTIAFNFITPLGEFERGIKFGPVSRLLRRRVTARTMPQDQPSPVDWVAGASLIVRREVFDTIGLMDEAYFLYFEEVDFCLRAANANWPCWYVPQSRVMHIAGASSNLTTRNARPPRTPAYWFASRRRYFRKHFGTWGAVRADLLFITGYALHRVRRSLTRRGDTDPPHHLRDFLTHSVLHRRNRTEPIA